MELRTSGSMTQTANCLSRWVQVNGGVVEKETHAFWRAWLRASAASEALRRSLCVGDEIEH